MSADHENEFITIADEDGKETDMKVIATVDCNDHLYFALGPKDAGEKDDYDVLVLRLEKQEGEEYLDTVDDRIELEQVYKALIRQQGKKQGRGE